MFEYIFTVIVKMSKFGLTLNHYADISFIYSRSNERITLPRVPDVENAQSLPPPYVVRVIVLYGRSHCIPVFKNTEVRASWCAAITHNHFYIRTFSSLNFLYYFTLCIMLNLRLILKIRPQGL